MRPHYLHALADETAQALDLAGLPRSATELRDLPLPGVGPGWLYTWCSTISSVTAYAGTRERQLREHGQPSGAATEAYASCWRLMAALCNEIEADLREGGGMSARPSGRWGALDSDHPARLTDDEIDRIDRDARSGADAVAIVAKVAAEKAYAHGTAERDGLKIQVDALTREVERMRAALDSAGAVLGRVCMLEALRRALRGEP